MDTVSRYSMIIQYHVDQLDGLEESYSGSLAQLVCTTYHLAYKLNSHIVTIEFCKSGEKGYKRNFVGVSSLLSFFEKSLLIK